jgi:hypothetical protein
MFRAAAPVEALGPGFLWTAGSARLAPMCSKLLHLTAVGLIQQLLRTS